MGGNGLVRWSVISVLFCGTWGHAHEAIGLSREYVSLVRNFLDHQSFLQKVKLEPSAGLPLRFGQFEEGPKERHFVFHWDAKKILDQDPADRDQISIFLDRSQSLMNRILALPDRQKAEAVRAVLFAPPGATSMWRYILWYLKSDFGSDMSEQWRRWIWALYEVSHEDFETFLKEGLLFVGPNITLDVSVFKYLIDYELFARLIDSVLHSNFQLSDSFVRWFFAPEHRWSGGRLFYNSHYFRRAIERSLFGKQSVIDEAEAATLLRMYVLEGTDGRAQLDHVGVANLHWISSLLDRVQSPHGRQILRDLETSPSGFERSLVLRPGRKFLKMYESLREPHVIELSRKEVGLWENVPIHPSRSRLALFSTAAIQLETATREAVKSGGYLAPGPFRDLSEIRLRVSRQEPKAIAAFLDRVDRESLALFEEVIDPVQSRTLFGGHLAPRWIVREALFALTRRPDPEAQGLFWRLWERIVHAEYKQTGKISARYSGQDALAAFLMDTQHALLTQDVWWSDPRWTSSLAESRAEILMRLPGMQKRREDARAVLQLKPQSSAEPAAEACRWYLRFWEK